MTATLTPPPPGLKFRTHVIIDSRGGTGTSSKPETSCGSATALSQAEVTATLPLPSAYCSTASESPSRYRCFLRLTTGWMTEGSEFRSRYDQEFSLL
jgi:hypothetical protein